MPFDPSIAPAGDTDETTPRPEAGATRRGMLLGVGLVGAAGALAACGSSSDDSDGSKQGGSGNGGGATAPAGGDGALGKAADIPVGGGKVFKDQKVVVTQPTQGQFAAFSAVCTHRGCTVGSVSGGMINCPCHGSKFKISDGSVANGPASEPLPRKSVTVQNGEIKLV